MTVEATPEDVAAILDQYKTIIHSDDSTGELVFEDIPVMFARAELMSSIYSELESMVGASAGGVLRSMGKAYGEKFYDLMAADQRRELLADREKLLNYVCAETEAIGWGRISIDEFPDKFIIISKEGMAAGRNYVGKSQHPVDSYFLGYFEGFFSRLNNTVYHGAETQCVAMGDAQCRMEFGTEPVF